MLTSVMAGRAALVMLVALVQVCSTVEVFELQVGSKALRFEQASPRDLTNLAREFVVAHNLTHGGGCEQLSSATRDACATMEREEAIACVVDRQQACVAEIITLRMLRLVAEKTAAHEV